MTKLIEVFGGEFIRLIIDKNHKIEVENDLHTQIVDAPIAVAGYLVDDDGEFLYLSEDEMGENINQVVKSSYVLYIEKSSPEQEVDMFDIYGGDDDGDGFDPKNFN